MSAEYGHRKPIFENAWWAVLRMKLISMLRIMCLFLCLAPFGVQAKTIQLYSYHIDPPFQLKNQTTDLSRSLVEKLNQWQQDRVFELLVLSRTEINKIISSGKPYLLLWANPLWFRSKDPNVQASKNIFWDADIWVSNRTHPVDYALPKDLIGKHIGARKGYYYKGITPLIKEGKIKASLVSNDAKNYQQLVSKKVEAFVMSRSSYLYWKASEIDVTGFNTSLSPHDAYKRHILVSQHYETLLPMLNQFIEQLKNNADWNSRLKKWGVQSLVEPIELDLDELMDY